MTRRNVEENNDAHLARGMQQAIIMTVYGMAALRMPPGADRHPPTPPSGLAALMNEKKFVGIGNSRVHRVGLGPIYLDAPCARFIRVASSGVIIGTSVCGASGSPAEGVQKG